MNVLELPVELIVKFDEYFTDYDRVSFVSSCRLTYSLRTEFKLDKCCLYNDIVNTNYINRIRNVKYNLTDNNINDEIPSNVNTLVLSVKKNSIKTKLNRNITRLEISRDYPGNIGPFIPEKLENLYLINYNQDIKSYLPKTLVKQKFHYCECELVPTFILSTIVELSIDSYNGGLVRNPQLNQHNQPNELYQQDYPDHCSQNKLPLIDLWKLPNLQYLNLGNRFYLSIDDRIPDSVETLIIGDLFDCSINLLKMGIKKLELGKNFNKPLDQLPRSLKQLKLGKTFNLPIDKLPNGLTHLIFNCESVFNHYLVNLPSNLKCIKLGCRFNTSIENCLPHGLIELRFGDYFNNPIKKKSLNMFGRGGIVCTKKFIPETVRKIKFGMYFDQDINDALPKDIKTVIIGADFSHKIKRIPPSIKIVQLEIGHRFGINRHLDNITHLKILNIYYFDHINLFPKHTVIKSKKSKTIQQHTIISITQPTKS